MTPPIGPARDVPKSAPPEAHAIAVVPLEIISNGALDLFSGHFSSFCSIIVSNIFRKHFSIQPFERNLKIALMNDTSAAFRLPFLIALKSDQIPAWFKRSVLDKINPPPA